MMEFILSHVEKGVMTLTLNRPERLNSFNDEMHAQLAECLKQVERDDTIRCLLLTGAGRGFCAGQDLNDRNVDPTGPAPDLGMSVERFYNPLVRRLAKLPKPVICAVNGVAAGAGATLALGCDIVIAARSAKFVMAFSKLGLVPDCGGTWLLPRVAGRARAMGLALLGNQLSAEQAHEWGMIWQVVDDETLADTAQQLARHLATQPTFGLGLIKQAINSAETNTLDTQLDLERDYQRLAGRSADYREGVSAFWLNAHRSSRGNSMMINVQTVAVIGSGTMGAGIAEVAASHGHQVLLYDISAEALTRAIDGIHARLNSRVTRGKLTAETCERTLKRLIPVTDIHALAAANLVIEAASERLEVKKALFAQLAEVCPPQTLLTTNTSSISITAIAAEVKILNVLRGCIFNPAPVMKLVEVVSGLATAAEVVEQLCELTLSWGKQPVRCHSTPGFIVNRVARPYYSEAWRALEEQVAAPEVIDAALRDGAGFPMGPLELTDLIGQDVNFAVTCSVFNAFWQERRFLPSLVQQELVIGGRLGKKSGLGVYDWRAEREAVVGLEAVSDSFSPMKVEKKSDGVTEIDDVLLIETQGETAQALAIRLARPVVVVDKMAGKVVTIAAAAVNPDSATRKAIYYLQQQGKTVLQIADYPEC